MRYIQWRCSPRELTPTAPSIATSAVYTYCYRIYGGFKLRICSHRLCIYLTQCWFRRIRLDIVLRCWLIPHPPPPSQHGHPAFLKGLYEKLKSTEVRSRERWILMLLLTNWRAGRQDGMLCVGVSAFLPPAPRSPPLVDGRGNCLSRRPFSLAHIPPLPPSQEMVDILTFKHDTARWMLIVKGFLIKFNGVGQREVVLAVSILLEMLIVAFHVIGEDHMNMVTALFPFGSCCL